MSNAAVTGFLRLVLLADICEVSHQCLSSLWLAWTPTKEAGPARPAGCKTAAAGSGGGETWCPGSVIYWDFDLDHPEKEEENQMCRNNFSTDFSMNATQVKHVNIFFKLSSFKRKHSTIAFVSVLKCFVGEEEQQLWANPHSITCAAVCQSR